MPRVRSSRAGFKPVPFKALLWHPDAQLLGIICHRGARCVGTEETATESLTTKSLHLQRCSYFIYHGHSGLFWPWTTGDSIKSAPKKP